MPLTLNGTTGIAGVDGSASTPSVQGSDTNTGVFYPAADTVGVSTGGSERMRVDSSGNVGIGTTSTLANSSLNVSQGVVARNSGATTGYFQLYNDTAGTDLKTWRIGNLSTGALKFETVNDAYTSATERMRLDSSGKVCINTTSPIASDGAFLNVNMGSSGLAFAFATSGTGQLGRFYANNTTNVGNISVTASATSYNTSSDYRLKHDIQPMQGALTKVAALKPVTYKWNVDGSAGEGFIAHELQYVVPTAVTGEKDAVNEDGSINAQGVDYSKIVVHLVAAIQELSAKVDAQAAEIAALKANAPA